VIESPFATVRLRQRVTKGAGSRTKGLLMAYNLLEMAQARWRGSTARTSCRSCAMGSPSWTACSKRTNAASPERAPRRTSLASPILCPNPPKDRELSGAPADQANRFRSSIARFQALRASARKAKVPESLLGAVSAHQDVQLQDSFDGMMVAQSRSTEVRMVSIRTVVLCTLVAAISSAAYAGSKAEDQGVREARAAIEAANARFSEAFARGDAKALAAMYTPDAIAFPPDSEMIRGNEAIGNFWKTTRDNGVQSATLTTVDVGRSGDVADEVGQVSLTIQPVGKEPTTAVAKYVVIWKRQFDGSWKLHRDIWNSLPAKQ